MLAEEARFGREVDPFLVAYELTEEAGLAIPDRELDAVQSLDDLARAVADHLPQEAGREARAAELVAGAARRSGCAYLLGETGSEVVRAWLGCGSGWQDEPGAPAERPRE
jgi:hypothetical protein